MSFIKAAIITISVLLLALMGYIFYSFGDDYQFNRAFESFSKGEYAEAHAFLKGIPSEKAKATLYQGYIVRENGNLLSSSLLFEQALSTEGATQEIKEESLFNNALNRYLLHDPEKLHQELEALRTHNKDSPWIPLFTSLHQTLLNTIPDKTFSSQEINEWTTFSPWMKKTIKQQFTPFWQLTIQGRIAIANGNYAQAKHQFEEALPIANDAEREELDLLLATTYIKEGEQKPVDTATAYYKLALPHLSRLPLDHQRFNHVRQQSAQTYAMAGLALMQQGLYNDLSFFAYAVDKFHDPSSSLLFSRGVSDYLLSLTKTAPTKNIDRLALALSRMPGTEKMRHALSTELLVLVEHSLQNKDPSRASAYWNAAKILAEDPSDLSLSFSKKIKALALKKIVTDDDSLFLTTPYLTLYLELPELPADKEE